jgi:enamine deaminase RidA (YjgF/YER057c/UK114 family)
MKDDNFSIEHINPEGLHKNPAYTQAVIVSGAAKTIYIGGQNAVDASGNIVGKENIKEQVEQIFKNLRIILDASGAKLENIVKWNIYVVDNQPIEPGFEVFQRVWDKRRNPPVITTVFVPKLGNPDFLVEIEATAIVPQN